MGVLTRRQPLFPALPGRAAGILLILLLLLAATVAIGVGALLLQNRPAPPFGIAANGLIAYSVDGDIYSAQPDGSQARLVIGGPTTDGFPGYSRDGRSLYFIRLVSESPEVIAVMTANADGSGVRTAVEAEQADGLYWWNVSPRGDVMAMANEAVSPRFSMINMGDGTRTPIDLPVRVEVHEWLPSGDEIVLIGTTDRNQLGIYAVRPDSSGFRTIVEPSGIQIGDLSVSDDGRYIAYNTFTQSGGELQLVELATGVGRTEPAAFGEWNLGPVFSPDSSQVAFTRYNNQVQPRIDAQVFVAPVDDLASAVAVGPMMPARAGGGGLAPHFSPDGTKLFITSNDLLESSIEGDAWLVDLATGTYEAVSLGTLDGFSWQRLAP